MYNTIVLYTGCIYQKGNQGLIMKTSPMTVVVIKKGVILAVTS